MTSPPVRVIRQLVLVTEGQCRVFRGGDNGRCERALVFRGMGVLSDAAVALDIPSPRPLGLGIAHALEPAPRPWA